MKYNWQKKSTPFKDFEEKEKYIFKDFSGAMTESRNYKIKGLESALELLKSFVKENIQIVGDYDVDGITSTTEMLLLLKHLKADKADFYLPRRFTDGYGLSESIVNKVLLGKKPGLLITVDNGIAAIEAVAKAKALGWSVLIIDHHQAPVDDKGCKLLPDADVIIDPSALVNEAAFTDYCAAGLVYKLAQIADIPEDLMAKINSFAALGTVADSVKLVEENEGLIRYDNYLIIKNGLHTLMQNEGRTVGLYCLLRGLNKDTKISEEDISFTIAPTINAISRMEDAATEAVNLFLCEKDFNGCDEIVQRMKSDNEERKQLTTQAIPVLSEIIESNKMENDYPIVVNASLHQGLIGLLAGQLSETYNTTVCVFTDVSKDGLLHGSARAPEGANIKEVLDKCQKWLDTYGGHKQAAGLSLKPENLDTFRDEANKVSGKKPAEFFSRYYDFEISPKNIEEELRIKALYAPFGVGHTLPVYKVQNFYAKKNYGDFYKLMGAEKKTIKIFGAYANAMNFDGFGASVYSDDSKIPLKTNFYGTISINEWNGKKENQIRFTDLDVLR